MKSYIILFDGICNFCNFWIDFLIKKDKNRSFRFAPLQSETGRKYLESFGLDTSVFESFIIIDSEKFYMKSDAVLMISKRLPFPYNLLSLFSIIPKSIRDWIYSKIAENRYKIFGKRASCRVPEAGESERFLP